VRYYQSELCRDVGSKGPANEIDAAKRRW
jgi:hypothetical protein